MESILVLLIISCVILALIVVMLMRKNEKLADRVTGLLRLTTENTKIQTLNDALEKELDATKESLASLVTDYNTMIDKLEEKSTQCQQLQASITSLKTAARNAAKPKVIKTPKKVVTKPTVTGTAAKKVKKAPAKKLPRKMKKAAQKSK